MGVFRAVATVLRVYCGECVMGFIARKCSKNAFLNGALSWIDHGNPVLSLRLCENTARFPARWCRIWSGWLSFLLLFRTIIKIVRRLLFRYGFGISNVLIIAIPKPL